MKLAFSKAWFKDIRFWIILLFVIRLYGVTFPPIEVGHNWRQTTVAMVARNFLEVDANILYPRVDIAGNKTGITGMEFPVFNYLIYAASKLFGYEHWYGRLINLIASSFGLYFFYLLVRKYWKEKVAFYGTLILGVSIWFQFSRKIMPDTFSMSLVIASIYYATQYLEQNLRQWKNLVLFASLFLIGVLSKLPSGYLLVCLALFIPNREVPISKKIIIGGVGALVLLPVIWWYFSWVPYLVQEFGFWHFFMGISFSEGALEIWNDLPRALSRFYDTAMKFSGFVAFLIGGFFCFRNKDRNLALLVVLSFLVFGIVIFKAGLNFSKHNYYIIPLVPVMALMAGYGLAQIRNTKIKYFILAFIMIEGVANQHSDFILKPEDQFIVRLEEDLDLFTQPEDLIFINSGDYPTVMYFAHRKGWVGSNQQLLKEDNLSQLKLEGLKYVLILKERFGSKVDLPSYTIKNETDNYTLYQIQ